MLQYSYGLQYMFLDMNIMAMDYRVNLKGKMLESFFGLLFLTSKSSKECLICSFLGHVLSTSLKYSFYLVLKYVSV